MTDRDQDSLIEIVLTFVLLFLATALFGEASLSSYRLFLMAGLLGGFTFAWSMRDKEAPATKYLLTLGSLCVLVWLIYSIAKSTLLYKDVLLICIKGLIFIEVVLSFDIHALAYMQLLCIPLYMCFPFFFQGRQEPLLMLIGLFNIIGWFILLKMNIYTSLNVPLNKIWLRRNFVIMSITVILLLSLLLGWILFAALQLDKMRKGGLFLIEEIDIRGSSSQTEETFYDLQDKLIKEMSDEIVERPALQDKYAMMNNLDVLIKKTEDAKEVRKAATALMSHLKIEGPGIKKLEEKKTSTTLKEYVKVTIKRQLDKVLKSMRENLQKTPMDIKGARTASAMVKKMHSSSSPKEVAEVAKKLQIEIRKSSIKAPVKEERLKLVILLKEWKSFELSDWERSVSLQEKMLSPQDKERKDLPESTLAPKPLTPEQQALIAQAEALKAEAIAEALTPEQQKLIAEAEAMKAAATPEALTPEQQALIAQAEALKAAATPENLTPEQQLSAQEETYPEEDLSPIDDKQEQVYPKEDLSPEVLILKEDKSIHPSLRRRETLIIMKVGEFIRWVFLRLLIWTLFILFLLILLILIGLLIWLVILYFLTRKRKKEIMALYHRHPGKFIISLNENIKGVLAIFGMPCKESTPPLHYAEFVEGRCPIKDDLFKRFTVKFEEAKYSRHVLQQKDSFTALNGYNGVLKTLFNNCRKSILATRFVLGLMQVRPFLMPDQPEAPR